MFRVDHHHHQSPVQPGGLQQLQLQGEAGAGDTHQISLKEVRGGGEERETVAGNINPHHRILRLERSIAWLKDQHGQMVASLHNEIETLKHRNRELQFQLILGGGEGGGGDVAGAETGGGGGESLTKPSLPPILTQLGSVPPLQAEILDNEIKELQAALHEAKSRNIYLSNVVEQQRKRLAALDNVTPGVTDPASPPPAAAQPPSIPPEFLKKLAEAEEMVAQLQQQNHSQREELDNIHQSLEREARMKYRGCNHPSKSTRLRRTSNSSSFDGRDLGRTRTSSQDSRLDLKTSERFPPLRSMLVPRSRRPSNNLRDVEMTEVGGSDSSIHTITTTTTLPRLSTYNSQPSIAQKNPKPGAGMVKTVVRRLPRDRSGARFGGSLDRKHSRS